jgi:hypothetical protein
MEAHGAIDDRFIWDESKSKVPNKRNSKNQIGKSIIRQ